MKNLLKKYVRYTIRVWGIMFGALGVLTYIQTARDAIDCVTGKIDTDDFSEGMFNRLLRPFSKWQ